MGTNFYMMTENKKLVEKYFLNEYVLTDEPYFGYRIHIGKRSAGWKPLFQVHKNAYDSVEGMMMFLSENQRDIRIFDEYDSELTYVELTDALINWAEHQPIRYMKYVPEGFPDEILVCKRYFIESTKDDYDITIPYDHIEYSKLVHDESEIDYSRDKDGYNFVEGEFS